MSILPSCQVSRGFSTATVGCLLLFILLPAPAAAGPPKIKFQSLLFPGDVVVNSERSFTLCLVNVGEANSLVEDEDSLTLSIPAGPGEGDLADAAGVAPMTCTPPAGSEWDCSVDLSDPSLSVVTLEPAPGSGSIGVGPEETICFGLEKIFVNLAEGLVFTELDQEIDRQRAERLDQPVLPVFKSMEGTVYHDDLKGVSEDQHHPETWILEGDAIHTKYPGKVGIGTVSPVSKLHVSSESPVEAALTVQSNGAGIAARSAGTAILGVSDGGIALRADSNASSASTPTALIENSSGPGLTVRGNFGGPVLNVRNSGIGDGGLIRGGSAGTALVVDGSGSGLGLEVIGKMTAEDLELDGKVTVKVLEITGADVAESFDFSEEVRPGMVVEIDPNRTGQLRLSREAYNRRVAGVVSGANGLHAGAILGHLPGREDAHAVGLSGRLWVYCDASSGPIEPGDLLTTASRPGYAMAVGERGAASGAILGKAMTRLAQGETGLVLTLVSLQ